MNLDLIVNLNFMVNLDFVVNPDCGSRVSGWSTLFFKGTAVPWWMKSLGVTGVFRGVLTSSPPSVHEDTDCEQGGVEEEEEDGAKQSG